MTDTRRRGGDPVVRRGRGAGGSRPARLLLAVLLAAGLGWLALRGGVGLWRDTQVLLGIAPAPPLDTRLEAGAAATPAPVDRLHDAVRRGDTDAVRALASALGAEGVNEVRGGMTAVMQAASRGEPALLQVLIERGGDPNRRGSDRRTALQYAAEKNRIEAARVLLAAGADIDAHDNSRLTPLVMAADRGYTDLGLLLIEAGADVDIAHVQGWTALIDAANGGNTRLVRRLLAAGADVDAKHSSGRTALDFARERGHAEIVRLLEQAR